MVRIKKTCLFFAYILLLGSLLGCGGTLDQVYKTPNAPLEITVVTPFNNGDGNRKNFVDAYKAYEAATGNIVVDVETNNVNEAWKVGVLSDFENGNEPDVIFYFTGADADELIKNDKLVSISTIRKEYPDYADNMKESLMPVSTYDGQQYAVSVYGYWEGLFVNKKVLESCGVTVPGTDYTWDQFLLDCQTIKDKGYTPIACSLADIPHYWFEYAVFNNGSVSGHTKVPEFVGDETGQNWVNGFKDIKALFDKGFFPENTNSASDDEIILMMIENRAAFMLEGSWKVGWFQERAEDKDNFMVTYVPAKGARKSTDAIGGFSMGYCITRKAWDDPQKREACVEFVKAMTADDVVSLFGELTVTTLKNGVVPSGELDSLAMSTLAMTKGCTAMVPAAQDLLNPKAREALFKYIPNIVTGEITPEQAIMNCLEIK